MPPLPAFDAEHLRLAEHLVFGLGRLDRELRGHPLAEAWALRAGMLAGAAAAEDGGLAVDRGRLLAAAAGLPIAVYRDDHGIPAALRHIQIQGAWFRAAAPEAGPMGPEDLARLAASGPVAEDLGPAVRSAFGWVAASLPACLEAMAAAPPGLAGALQAAWRWVRDDGDPMALTVAFPLALQAQGLSCRPLPGLFPRPRPTRPAGRWLRLALEDLVARTATATQLLHGLERARHGLLGAVAGARSSSRLPAVAELALTTPAIAAPTVVRHLTRLARRGGPLGRTTPEVIAARKDKTAVSRASAGEMLRLLAASGWLVELTGSRTHRAYVPRDLAELGVDVQPARLRPQPGRQVEEEPLVIPPLPSPAERKAPLEVDFTEVFMQLRAVESRIETLLSERGLPPRSTHPTLDPSGIWEQSSVTGD